MTKREREMGYCSFVVDFLYVVLFCAKCCKEYSERFNLKGRERVLEERIRKSDEKIDCG